MRNEMQFNVGSHAADIPPLTSVATFCRGIGRTPVTAWRWQKQGWLDPSINIAGKPYLTREAIEKFTRRAAAGEFAKAPHVPRKEKNGKTNVPL
jgi:hypothetical protein